MPPLPPEILPEIAALCRRFAVARLELFGSATRPDFDPAASDIDFLVDFQDPTAPGIANRYFGLLHALEDLLARPIDLVDRSAVTNPHFLPIASQSQKLLYAA